MDIARRNDGENGINSLATENLHSTIGIKQLKL